MRTILLASFTLLVALIAPLAHAQPLRPQALSEAERDAVIFTLGLGDDEIERLDELAEANTVERRAVIDAYQARMREAYEAMARGDGEFDIQLLTSGANDVQDKLNALQSELVADVALVVENLAPERVESCRLRLRRMEILDTFGSDISALTADPLVVAMRLALPEGLDEETTERFRFAMLMYDRDVAARLEGFTDIRDRAMAFMGPAGAGEGSPAMMDFMEDMLEFVNELRETHTERARGIAETLPTELRTAWDDAWRREAFPTVYSTHWTEAVFERLIEAEELTDEEAASALSLSDEFANRLESLRVELCGEIDRAQDRLALEDAMSGRMPSNDDIRELRQRIKELADEARLRLEEAVAPEHHELIAPAG